MTWWSSLAGAAGRWYQRTGETPDVWPILDPNALTIGFARRFATYKRATLISRIVTA